MDSDNDSYHSESEFYYPDEENVLKETKLLAQKLLLKQSRRINKHVICRPWSVRIGKNCARGLEYGPRAVLKTKGTVFPNTDRPRTANNIFILL